MDGRPCSILDIWHDVVLDDAKGRDNLCKEPTGRQVFLYRDSSMTYDERLMGLAYDNLGRRNRLPSGQPSACCSKRLLRDMPCKKVKDSSYVGFYGVAYISRQDRRLGEEQPPPPPLVFENGAEVEAIPSLFSEAESQDGFGTGFHLRNPRPGLFSPTLEHDGNTQTFTCQIWLTT